MLLRPILSAILLLAVMLPAPSQAWIPPSAQEQQMRTMLQQRTFRAQKRLTKTLSKTFVFRITRRGVVTAVMQKSVTSSSAATKPIDTRFDRRQEEVLLLVNKERASAHLPLLSLHPLLNDSAQRYAARMREERFFSHTDPDGRSSLDRIRDTGYIQAPCDCSWEFVTGENLASNMFTPAEVVRAWMDSPAHRVNILHPQFNDMGLGYESGTWVQHFGGIKKIEERT